MQKVPNATEITVSDFTSDPQASIARARRGEVTHIVGAEGEVFVLGLNDVRHLPSPEFDLPDLDLLEAVVAKARDDEREGPKRG